MAGCIAGMIVLPLTAIWAITGIIGHIFRALIEMIAVSVFLLEIAGKFTCWLYAEYKKIRGNKQE